MWDNFQRRELASARTWDVSNMSSKRVDKKLKIGGVFVEQKKLTFQPVAPIYRIVPWAHSVISTFQASKDRVEAKYWALTLPEKSSRTPVFVDTCNTRVHNFRPSWDRRMRSFWLVTDLMSRVSLHEQNIRRKRSIVGRNSSQKSI